MDRNTRLRELERVAVWLKYLEKATPARSRFEGAYQQAEWLPRLRKATEPDFRWMLERYDAAHKVGGSRNYVLVPGNPPLTLDMVERLSDYVNCTGGRWLVYGMTAAQRQQFRELVIADWTAGGAGRDALIADLKTWDAASKLTKAEQDKYIERTRCQ